MNKSRRHHFVPQMLLKRFTDDDGYLYVFDKDKPEKVIQHCRPKGAFWKLHLHTSRTVDGTKDTTLEDDFSKLESDTDPIIKKIVSQARKGESPNLTEEEKKTWDRFFYTQWKRTPDNMQKIGIDEIFATTFEESVTTLETIFPHKSEELHNLRNPDYSDRIKQNAKVDALKKDSINILDVLNNKGLGITRISSANKSFIIGSFPVLKLTNDGRTHLSDPTVEAWLPIAHDIIVTPALEKGEEKLVALNDKSVRRLNMLFAKQSTTIAGRSEKLIRSLAFPR